MVETEEMARCRCEFASDGSIECEQCFMPIPPGEDIYFVSDGPPNSRDGVYLCKKCAADICG